MAIGKTVRNRTNDRTDQTKREKQKKTWNKYGWPIRTIDIKDDGGEEFARTIQNNKGKIVCDGSFKDKKSSSAFVTITDKVVRGTNIVPGRGKDQSAYRGEMGGILGSILTAKILCDKYGVEKGSMTIGCDCEGAIKACESYKTPTCRWTSYDIVCRIKYEKSKWKNFKCKFRHVNSHQDDITKFEELDNWEKANVEADLLAKKTLLTYVTKGCPPIKTDIQKGDKWALLVDEE
jgi:hypothetical protein